MLVLKYKSEIFYMGTVGKMMFRRSTMMQEAEQSRSHLHLTETKHMGGAFPQNYRRGGTSSYSRTEKLGFGGRGRLKGKIGVLGKKRLRPENPGDFEDEIEMDYGLTKRPYLPQNPPENVDLTSDADEIPEVGPISLPAKDSAPLLPENRAHTPPNLDEEEKELAEEDKHEEEVRVPSPNVTEPRFTVEDLKRDIERCNKRCATPSHHGIIKRLLKRGNEIVPRKYTENEEEAVDLFGKFYHQVAPTLIATRLNLQEGVGTERHARLKSCLLKIMDIPKPDWLILRNLVDPNPLKLATFNYREHIKNYTYSQIFDFRIKDMKQSSIKMGMHEARIDNAYRLCFVEIPKPPLNTTPLIHCILISLADGFPKEPLTSPSAIQRRIEDLKRDPPQGYVSPNFIQTVNTKCIYWSCIYCFKTFPLSDSIKDNLHNHRCTQNLDLGELKDKFSKIYWCPYHPTSRPCVAKISTCSCMAKNKKLQGIGPVRSHKRPRKKKEAQEPTFQERREDQESVQLVGGDEVARDVTYEVIANII